MEKKKRKMFQANEEVDKYIREQAENWGMSESAFVNMCIKQYKDQQMMMSELGKFQMYMDKMEKMLEKNKG